MESKNILSVQHFAASQQVAADYTSLLVYEQELKFYSEKNKKMQCDRIKEDMIALLERIKTNKHILDLSTKADETYILQLQKL